MNRISIGTALVATMFLVSGTLAQASLTGTLTGDPVQFAANSTNELNFNQQTPGREGQVAPYVILNSADATSVTLEFNNGANGLAFFEYRVDGVSLTPDSTHDVAIGDDIYPGVALPSGTTGFLRTFDANSMVEIRLALGGERDWDFNWTAFPVDDAVVPEPSSIAIWSLISCGVVILYRRRLAS